MKDITIQESLKPLLPSPFENNQKQEGQGETFFETLKDAIGEASKLQVEADQAVQELGTGENKDIHSTMIAIEKADVSFQLMMQVRNKIISAYETIMHMSV